MRARPSILLTGAAGQLGAELGAALREQGDLVATDRTALDLAEPDAIVGALRGARPDLVVNAAAYTAVDLAETEPAVAYAVNGRAPGILAEEAKRLGAVLIHYSTDYVFDGTRTTPYAEDAPTRPLNVYGASKLAGEGLAGVAERAGLYHLSASGSASWYDFACAILGDAGHPRVEPITTAEYPLPARRPAYAVLATDRFAQTFGFVLPDWRDALAACLTSPPAQPVATSGA
jgi:dTDP-4-dehydrorhamnose reductase